MTTQEKLEAITLYYPHKVKCVDQSKSIVEITSIIGCDPFYEVKQQDTARDEVLFRTIDDTDMFGTSGISQIKLILRPMSDLTKPCLEGGKVPIVELGKIVELLEPISYNEMADFKGKLNGACAIDRHDNQWLMFDFKEGFSMWHKPHGCQDHVLTLLDHQLQLFQQLYKWHFWLGDQSEFGKSIIDINTIKTE